MVCLLLYGDLYVLFEEVVGCVLVGVDGVLFLLYLMGECSLVWDVKVSGVFVGLSFVYMCVYFY